jgi:hypothetical protein
LQLIDVAFHFFPNFTIQKKNLFQKKTLPIKINGNNFTRLLAAFRRMTILPNSPQELGGASEGTESEVVQSGSSAVFGSILVDTGPTFSNGAKLLRVSEILTPSPPVSGAQQQQRVVEQKNVWIGSSDEQVFFQPLFLFTNNNFVQGTTIKFVDLGASPIVPELLFEFLFGRPEHFRSPYFADSSFQIKLSQPLLLPPQDNVVDEIIYRIRATSPLNLPLNYTMLSREQTLPFQVIPSTGDIVLRHMPSPPPPQQRYCMNVAVSDSSGRTTRVPLEIITEPETARNETTGKCPLFPSGEIPFLHRHIFDGKTGNPSEEDSSPQNHHERGQLVTLLEPFMETTTAEFELPSAEKEEEKSSSKHADNEHHQSTMNRPSESNNKPSAKTTPPLSEEAVTVTLLPSVFSTAAPPPIYTLTHDRTLATVAPTESRTVNGLLPVIEEKEEGEEITTTAKMETGASVALLEPLPTTSMSPPFTIVGVEGPEPTEGLLGPG